MPSVCLIGDSHLAALKMGWPSIEPGFPGAALHFYAGGGMSIPGLAVEGRALVATTPKLRVQFERSSGGRHAIAPDHDAYVVVGYGLDSRAAQEAFRSVVAGQGNARVLAAVLRETTMATVLRKLRAVTDRPAMAIAAPHPVARDDGLWARLKSRGLDGAAAALFNRACEMVAAEHGARFLPQPDATLGNSAIVTQDRFATGPSRFAVPGPEEDKRHMNDAYGAIVLGAVLNAIRS